MKNKKVLISIVISTLFIGTISVSSAFVDNDYEFSVTKETTNTIQKQEQEINVDNCDKVSKPIFTTFIFNNPPYEPSNPMPENLVINIEPSNNFILQWSAGDPDKGDVLYYHIYYGTDPDDFKTCIIGTYPNDHTLIIWNVRNFFTEYNTTYYWKIVAEDNHGEITEGPMWKFRTVSLYDIDRDGKVDPFDVITVMSYFGCNVDVGCIMCDRCDVNGDGTVDSADYKEVMDNM